MATKRKVIPARPDAIGTVHPVDGALRADGSKWTMDTFTQRRLHEGSIALHQEPASTKPAATVVSAPVETAKPVAKLTTQKPKIET